MYIIKASYLYMTWNIKQKLKILLPTVSTKLNYYSCSYISILGKYRNKSKYILVEMVVGALCTICCFLFVLQKHCQWVVSKQLSSRIQLLQVLFLSFFFLFYLILIAWIDSFLCVHVEVYNPMYTLLLFSFVQSGSSGSGVVWAVDR